MKSIIKTKTCLLRLQFGLVFNPYWETSIKNNECSRLGASTALKVKICGNATPNSKTLG